MHDRYGWPLATQSPAARDAYVAGVDGVLAAGPEVRAQLTAAVAADPHFALAQIALARALFLDAELRPARESVVKARELAAGASERERSHVNAIALAIEGRPVEALAATRGHLARWPRDAMVLAPATGVFGLIGFSGRQDREEELYRLLDALAADYGDDWWFCCVRAFAACETGRLDEAARLIDDSMQANPRNAHGAHVRAHVWHEAGECAAALAFLEDWLPDYDRRGLMHCHLSWHRALSALLLGRADSALAAYHAAVHPGAAWGPPINVVTDSVSFLWRLQLAGGTVPAGLWQDVARYALQSFPRAGLSFADVHSAAACAATGDSAAIERVLGELRERLASGKLPAGPAVLKMVEGLAAFAAGDPVTAIEALEFAIPETVRIGGSRAQRDLVELTLLAAYLRAGRAEPARRLLGRRTDRRPRIEVTGAGEIALPM